MSARDDANQYLYKNQSGKPCKTYGFRSLEVVAELGRTTLRLRDIYNLNVGDVIDLNRKKDSEVFLRIGGQKWFDGMMGVSEKHLAVKIKQVYHKAERRGSQGNE